MLKLSIVRLVAWSVRYALWVIALSILLAVASGIYVAHHFKINTDISRLVETDAQWTGLENAMDAAFPDRGQTVLVVVEARAPEFADAAARDLTAALRKQSKEFVAVSQPEAGPFFEHNGLLFLPLNQVQSTTTQLTQARPLINSLAHDPSLTGLAGVLTTSLLLPLQIGQIKLADMSHLLSQSATVLDGVLAGQPSVFSWRALVDKDAAKEPARAFVTVQPVVDFGALEPGARASADIRATAASLHLDTQYGATVRLTGEQPLGDEEFAWLKDGGVVNGNDPAMLTLWGRKSSINVQKVMWALGELGLAYDHIDAGGDAGGLDDPAFRAMNPHGRVPVLKDGDAAIWESHTIVRYLCATYAPQILCPTHPRLRAQAEQWMDWTLATLQPAIMGLFLGWKVTPAAQRDESRNRQFATEAAAALQILDQWLNERPFVAGGAV